MHFFQLIRQEMRGTLRRLIVISSIAGASNAAALGAINSSAQTSGNEGTSVWMAGAFAVSLFVFVKTQDYLLVATTNEIGAIVHRLQSRLADEVRQSELVMLEGIGRPAILTAILGHTTTLTQAAQSLALAGQGFVMLFFVGIYIAYLSPLIFTMSAIMIGMIIWVIHVMNRAHSAGAIESSGLEDRMLNRLTDFLDGFREIRLNHARSEELFDDTIEVSRQAANIRIRTQSDTFRGTIFTQSSLYGLLGIVVFVLPRFGDVEGDAIAKVTLPLLFLVGSCFGAVQAIPVIAAANAATDGIMRIESRLRSARTAASVSPSAPRREFNEIRLHDIVFHRDEPSTDTLFQVGPLNFTLHSGDIVFITGGNGSGKSTFLKLLAGLYEPLSGDITFDGVRVNARTRQDYHELMAAIFSDFHLFQRPYGIAAAELNEVDRLLTYFELDRKTGLVEGEFTTLDLSSGQRKRLALVIGLLENRPILLLDEWTAEQDPEFRRTFYQDFLPELKRSGTTVVMITHDELEIEELSFPSRRLRMDEGRFVERHTTEIGV
ncbi:ATP-binding cassette domain-containing protein [Bradyrhizobium oligotrophicum]